MIDLCVQPVVDEEPPVTLLVPRQTRRAGSRRQQPLHIAKRQFTRASHRGVKVVAESGWFAARPSGTESIYKIYAESFRDAEHLSRILAEAQLIVDAALSAAS